MLRNLWIEWLGIVIIYLEKRLKVQEDLSKQTERSEEDNISVSSKTREFESKLTFRLHQVKGMCIQACGSAFISSAQCR